MEDDGLFPHGIDALHVNSVSYNFEKKYLLRWFYCVQVLLKSNIIQIWSFKHIFKINLIQEKIKVKCNTLLTILSLNYVLLILLCMHKIVEATFVCVLFRVL